MRPQHITAENVPIDIASDWEHTPGFNEAAAYHCGKPAAADPRRDRRRGFNEAAAYHCGKRGRRRGRACGPTASMRPQHITAENGGLGVLRARARIASMRPQHITAENGLARRDPAPDRHASMRPQHITAENPHEPGELVRLRPASMRPQHITAENSSAARRAATIAVLQ